MVDLKDIIRTNPSAAKEFNTIKAALEALKELRDAGVIKSAESFPNVKRPSVIGHKPKSLARQRFFLPLQD
ncbi:hypothetical protein G6L89_010320 [Agrobacterium fabrum]|uniref:hypothetical protein n=1 Tax=Agrobacterium fabrum TaxID=1176649 RepID=UPI0015747CE4|nr:hypothetical protein [Agrobacterium fabrum]NTB08223.1 hypothetical protein [Agrobacterium fabrum]